MKKIKLGFTLIELIIVIAILGMLSTAGVSSYINSMKTSRDAKRKTDLETIRQALEMYKSDNSSTGYPNATTGNATTYLGCASCPLSSPTTYINSANFPQDPQNSSTNNYYYYERLTNSTYKLGAILENAVNNCGATPPDCHTPSISCNYCVTQP